MIRWQNGSLWGLFSLRCWAGYAQLVYRYSRRLSIQSAGLQIRFFKDVISERLSRPAERNLCRGKVREMTPRIANELSQAIFKLSPLTKSNILQPNTLLPPTWSSSQNVWPQNVIPSSIYGSTVPFCSFFLYEKIWPESKTPLTTCISLQISN